MAAEQAGAAAELEHAGALKVRQQKGEAVEEELDPVVTVDVAAYLPQTYVAEPSQRLVLYRRLAGVRTPADVEEARRELRDRFGALPAPAEQLLDVVGLRLAARALRLERLEVRAGRALLTFASSTGVRPERLLAVLRAHPRRLRLVREFVVEAAIPRAPWRDTLAGVVAWLKELS